MAIGRTNTGGGGAGLNFSVSAYASADALPASASANSIAVITENHISSWIFDATEPESHSEGGVWFKIGTSSIVEFNALKTNGIQVYPISAKQYIGGSWVDVVAKSYQNGAWVDWWNGQLYEAGNTFEAITGGYTTYGDGTTVTENTDHLYIESQGPSGVYTNDLVDMTDYTTLTFDWTCVRGGIDIRFQVRADKSTGGSGWASGTTITGPDAKRHTTTLDISGLSGGYYIGIGRFSSGGPAQIRVHSIIMS